jgi:hypothetical protein
LQAARPPCQACSASPVAASVSKGMLPGTCVLRSQGGGRVLFGKGSAACTSPPPSSQAQQVWRSHEVLSACLPGTIACCSHVMAMLVSSTHMLNSCVGCKRGGQGHLDGACVGMHTHGNQPPQVHTLRQVPADTCMALPAGSRRWCAKYFVPRCMCVLLLRCTAVPFLPSLFLQASFAGCMVPVSCVPCCTAQACV